ncbi:hypothetical protein [Phaffia rhodozyma]|uniref:Secreted peptide n=1 Tax=Phaffia rhodozyma TaxID=264483 RepID=A0A0F7SVV5_PHARH|nr:hypothetical protein [Phaffia rhodozyma]
MSIVHPFSFLFCCFVSALAFCCLLQRTFHIQPCSLFCLVLFLLFLHHFAFCSQKSFLRELSIGIAIHSSVIHTLFSLLFLSLFRTDCSYFPCSCYLCSLSFLT